MSGDTRAAVEDALRAHLKDEHDHAILTGYLIVACGVSAEDSEPATRYEFLNGAAPWHETAGLIRYAERYHDDDLERAFCGEDDQ